MKTTIVIRAIARIWSVASLVFVALLATSGGEFPTPRELIALVVFPVGVLAGLLVAWRHEGIGGLVAVSSLIAFYLWMIVLHGRPPGGPYFAIVAGPGFLFLALWLFEKFHLRTEAQGAT